MRSGFHRQKLLDRLQRHHFERSQHLRWRYHRVWSCSDKIHMSARDLRRKGTESTQPGGTKGH